MFSEEASDSLLCWVIRSEGVGQEVSTASCDLVNVCCGSDWSIVACRDKKQECSEFAFAQQTQNFLHKASGQRSFSCGPDGNTFVFLCSVIVSKTWS